MPRLSNAILDRFARRLTTAGASNKPARKYSRGNSMRRRFAVLTIAAAAVLGLTACAGSPSAETGGTGDGGAAAPASNQSVADACAIVTVKVNEAATAMPSLETAVASDPQVSIDAFTVAVDGIGEAADSVTNAEVKTAATALHADYVSMRDLMTKVLVEQDMSVNEELNTVTTDLTTSAQALATLCAV